MQPFRNLALKKSSKEIELFLSSAKSFYPIDLFKFFNMSGTYVYTCFRYIRKSEGLDTEYIPQSIMKKYLDLRA